MPSPEEEIQAVLPEDVLAALDAPIEGEEGEDEVDGGPSRVTTSGGGRSNTTGVRDEAQRQVAPRPPSMRTRAAHARRIERRASNAGRTADADDGGATTGERQRTEGGTTWRDRHASARAAHAIRARARDAAARAVALHDRSELRGDDASPRRSSSIPPPRRTSTPSASRPTLGSELLVAQVGMFGAPVPAFGQPQAGATADAVASGERAAAVARAVDVRGCAGDTPPLSRAMQASMQSVRARRQRARGGRSGPSRSAHRRAARARASDRRASDGRAHVRDAARRRATASNVRRIVLREGDIVTAASGVDTESLLAFLGARGDLPRERVEALSRPLAAVWPPRGRGARRARRARSGAALARAPRARGILDGSSDARHEGTALLEADAARPLEDRAERLRRRARRGDLRRGRAPHRSRTRRP